MATPTPANPKGGSTCGGWRLVKRIGAGGNGVVWRASKPGLPDRAIKILKKVSATAYARFKAEVEALSLASDIAGIVPMLEHNLPERIHEGHPWYAMPLAEPFSSFISKKSHTEIASQFVLLAVTLSQLHRRSIHHRDIKPANLLALDNRLCFSDFGLVKFPKRPQITPRKEDVGPKFTMAPEMRRTAYNAAGGPADVYSLGKSLWIALTKQPLAFDGQYSADSYLGLKRYMPDAYATPLDELITDCTNNDPLARPTIDEMKERLAEWIELEADFEKRNPREWNEIQKNLFPLGFPEHAAWHDIDAILSVLQSVSATRSLNHMFFPSGGGMTIDGVSRSAENGFIVLHHGNSTVFKPKKLTFESFAAGTQWNYFRLEAEEVSPVLTSDALSYGGFYEALCELAPGEYTEYEAWDSGTYQGGPIPTGARPIARYLKGAFVIFSTRSPYNLDPATYDARHNAMNEDEFRTYIDRNSKRPRR